MRCLACKIPVQASIINLVAKRTLFTLLCLLFVLLVWQPAPKERAIRQQFAASASALMVCAAGSFRLVRRRKYIPRSEPIRLPCGGTYQVLRI